MYINSNYYWCCLHYLSSFFYIIEHFQNVIHDSILRTQATDIYKSFWYMHMNSNYLSATVFYFIAFWHVSIMNGKAIMFLQMNERYFAYAARNPWKCLKSKILWLMSPVLVVPMTTGGLETLSKYYIEIHWTRKGCNNGGAQLPLTSRSTFYSYCMKFCEISKYFWWIQFGDPIQSYCHNYLPYLSFAVFLLFSVVNSLHLVMFRFVFFFSTSRRCLNV